MLEPQLSMYFVRPVVGCLARRGMPAARAARDFGVTAAELDKPGGAIGFGRHVNLVTQGSKFLRSSNLGLHVYDDFDLTRFGPMGHLLHAAPDFLTGIKAFAPLLMAVDTGTRVEILHGGRDVEIVFYNADERYSGNRFDIAQTLMFLIASLRTYVDPRWAPECVEFQFPALSGDALREYESVIRAPLRYSRPVNRVICARAALLQPLPHADIGFFRFLEASIRRTIDDGAGASAFLNDVRGRIEPALAQGCRIDEVAAAMGLSSRVLQQRLAASGTSYRDVVQDIRQVIACRRIAGGDVRLTALAADLGYSETSAFVRAFRRWTGFSPLRYARREACRTPLR
jgi:AraC-like DNA-binding protein